MAEHTFTSKILWCQIDANQHLRHSAYADFCAQARMELLESLGFNAETFTSFNLGPILFREELIYLREIKAGDTVQVKTVLTKINDDASKWSFQQEVFSGNGTKAAIVHVDGAWMDTVKRKLTGLPEEFLGSFKTLPKGHGFQSV